MHIQLPSRDACDSCFNQKMLLKRLKSRACVLEEDAEENDIENGDKISDYALHITQVRP